MAIGASSSPIAGVGAAPANLATPTAGATAAVSAPAIADNNIAATQAANQAYVAANPNTFSPPPASSTTASNTSKIAAVSGITATTNGFSQSGITTNPNGTTTYANGTVYDPTQPTSSTNVAPTQPTSDLSQPGISQGGYFGETYIAPGSPIPIGPNGLPVTLTPNSPTNQGILDSLNAAKASADAMTANVIDRITAGYNNLISQQEQVNQAQNASRATSLLKGGVTGSGSSSQYAPISSAGVIQAQVSYGIQQVANLQSKESDAIIAAQQAGQDEDFKLQQSINDEIKSIRDEKVAAAQKVNDQIQTANQKLADAKIQQTKDDFVASQLQAGVTDPQAILKAAKDAGLTISAAEIGTSLAALSPDKAAIQSLAAKAAEAGADAATVAKITGSANFNDALSAATPALGAKTAADLKQQAFDNQIKLQQSKDSAAQVAIAQENADTARAKLQQDNSTAAQTAANATVTTPSGKTYVDGSGLDASGKAAALNAGLTVLDGDSAKAMTTISNTLGQVNNLLSSLKSSGVDLGQQDKNGVGTNVGGTMGFNHYWAAGAATPALRNFASSLVGTGTSGTNGIIPGTGDLVATLQNNIPKDTDTGTILQNKITAITAALESTENSYLANAGTPPEGTTGTINGQNVIFKNGNWETQ